MFATRVNGYVKIRGVRVSLPEIEDVLRRHPAIQEMVVVDYPSGENNEAALGALYLTRDGTPAAVRDPRLRHRLSALYPYSDTLYPCRGAAAVRQRQNRPPSHPCRPEPPANRAGAERLCSPAAERAFGAQRRDPDHLLAGDRRGTAPGMGRRDGIYRHGAEAAAYQTGGGTPQ